MKDYTWQFIHWHWLISPCISSSELSLLPLQNSLCIFRLYGAIQMLLLFIIIIKMSMAQTGKMIITATITSTNIRLFCDVFLMKHINWLCCCLPQYSIVIHFSCISLFPFLPGDAVLQLHTDVFTFLQHCCYVVVCRFVRSLVAFVSQEIKGLLTYSQLTNNMDEARSVKAGRSRNGMKIPGPMV